MLNSLTISKLNYELISIVKLNNINKLIFQNILNSES